jgi:hypothetical protein
MKNLFSVLFVAVTAFVATASHAGIDCGSHKVQNVYQGGDHGTILFAVAKTDGTVTKYARPDMNVFNTPDKVRSLVSIVTAAKLSSSNLRIQVADGASCSEGEYRTYAVVLE